MTMDAMLEWLERQVAEGRYVTFDAGFSVYVDAIRVGTGTTLPLAIRAAIRSGMRRK